MKHYASRKFVASSGFGNIAFIALVAQTGFANDHLNVEVVEIGIFSLITSVTALIFIAAENELSLLLKDLDSDSNKYSSVAKNMSEKIFTVLMSMYGLVIPLMLFSVTFGVGFGVYNALAWDSSLFLEKLSIDELKKVLIIISGISSSLYSFVYTYIASESLSIFTKWGIILSLFLALILVRIYL